VLVCWSVGGAGTGEGGAVTVHVHVVAECIDGLYVY
jgi:hypothetical protein